MPAARLTPEEPDMKITDATLTLFAWDSIPSTTYGHHTARPTGKSDLGLLRIATDEGLEGHAFLGPSSTPLLKPSHSGRAQPDPLPEAGGDGPGSARSRAPQPPLMGARPRRHGSLDRRRRYRAVGHRRQEGGAADPSPHGPLPRQDRGLREFGDPRRARGICRAGTALPVHRVGRLQDPPA